MAFIFSKEKRTVYMRKIEGFWEEFSRKRIGLFGMAILIFYVVLAVIAPVITPYDPVARERVAEDFAIPAWMTVLPQHRTGQATRVYTLYWDVGKEPQFVKSWGESVVVEYRAKTVETVDVELTTKFSYNELPPNSFYFKFEWGGSNVESTEYSMTMTLLTPEGANTTSWVLWSRSGLRTVWAEHVYVESVDPFFRDRLGFGMEDNPTKIILSQKGEYTLLVRMRFKPDTKTARCQIDLKNAQFTVPGSVHGVLGCDDTGADLFSQLVYGTRISLMIGILSAVASASIGILVGVITGYFGGIVDEAMMRVVDILLCLPFLPLLLTLVTLYGTSIFYIVIFIAIFGWQGLARMIRSQVLSLRETAFVDCARAAGASRFYIIAKHLIPNVLPVAFASLVLSVPSAILFEAALSFLGFGDPRVPTWGKMLHHAYGFGAFTRLAWWWIIPPGLAITTLCLAFVFIGHSLDEVVNPRLRRRR